MSISGGNSVSLESISGSSSLDKITGFGSGWPSLLAAIKPTTVDGWGITDAEKIIATGTHLQYWRGDKTWQTLNTDAVTEGTQLYYTDDRVSSYLNGAGSSVLTSNLTAARVLVSDNAGKISAHVTISPTQLGYLSGLTANVQSAIDKLNEMFEFATSSAGEQYIRAKYSLASVGGLTARAAGTVTPWTAQNMVITGLWNYQDTLTITKQGGALRLKGNTTGINNVAYIEICDVNGVRQGWIGDGWGDRQAIGLSNDASQKMLELKSNSVMKYDGPVELGGGGYGAVLSLIGSSTGVSNVCYMGFYESNGTTRKGWIGDGAGNSDSISLCNDVSGKYIELQSGGLCYYNGNINASGTVTWASDIRLKSNIVTISDAIKKNALLQGCTYIKGGEKEAGVIAQHVRAVLPEAVIENPNTGMLAVNYGGVVALNTQAINELGYWMGDMNIWKKETNTEVEALKKRVSELESQLMFKTKES